MKTRALTGRAVEDRSRDTARLARTSESRNSATVARPSLWRGHRFVIERDPLRQRAGELGVRGAVDVKLTRYRNNRGTSAAILLRDDGWRIVLDTTLDAEDASLCLYHEIGHAIQSQQLGGWERLIARQRQEMVDARLMGPSRRRFGALRAYQRTPLEWEADAWAYAWHDELPLAQPRRP